MANVPTAQYRTKVDAWLLIVLAGAIAVPIGLGLGVSAQTGAHLPLLLSLAVAFFIALLICLLAVPTRYDVTADALKIRSGLLHWEIPLAQINSIRPTANPLSSPAWSLNRLEIVWESKDKPRSILISPARAEEFLREIASRNRSLVAAPGGLHRTFLPDD